jgi:hypothetical protein
VYDDFRLPVITACCAALGLPLADVVEVEPGRFAPRVRIDLNPWAPGDGTIAYRVGAGGSVAVRAGAVERRGHPAPDWDPPMVADDATVRAALVEAHRGLFGAEWCENRPMNYPTYPIGSPMGAPWRIGIHRDPPSVHLIVTENETELGVEDIDKLTSALAAGRGVLTGFADPVDDEALAPDVRDALRGFEFAHLPPDLRAVSIPFRDLAYTLAELLPEDSETVCALRKLVEAKDCAVRAVVFNRETS